MESAFPNDVVQTIDDLRSLAMPPITLSRSVTVLGYWAVGDGGGGLFAWAPGATNTDDRGTIFASTIIGAPAGRWKRIYSGAVDVRWFGAVGDGAADDTCAIDGAVLASVTHKVPVYFSGGIYRITRGLEYSQSIELHGVQGRSIIKPSAAVAVALTLNTPSTDLGTTDTAKIIGLTFDGSNTSGATGIKLGTNVVTARVCLQDVEVYHFHGAGAYGIHVVNLVGCMFQGCYFGRSWINLYALGGTVDYATTVTFNKCSFREADTRGVCLASAYQFTFNDCLFEANQQEGVYLAPGAGHNIILTTFNNCWWEGNWAANTANYQLAADGSASGSTCSIQLRGGYFNAAMAMLFKNVVDFVVDGTRVQAVKDAILVEGGGAQGHFVNLPRSIGDVGTYVTIASDVPSGNVTVG